MSICVHITKRLVELIFWTGFYEALSKKDIGDNDAIIAYVPQLGSWKLFKLVYYWSLWVWVDQSDSICKVSTVSLISAFLFFKFHLALDNAYMLSS